MEIFRGLPSVRAWATFLRALLTSRQIVPRDTPIFVPACSWDKSSRSTRRKASSSAGSIVMVVPAAIGWGMKLRIFVGFGMVTGLGSLPRRPRLYLRPHDIVINSLDITEHLYIFVHYQIIVKCAYAQNREVKKCQKEIKQDQKAPAQ